MFSSRRILRLTIGFIIWVVPSILSAVGLVGASVLARILISVSRLMLSLAIRGDRLCATIQHVMRNLAQARTGALNVLVRLAKDDLVHMDLTDLVLAGVDLSEADLARVDLSGADLREARFSWACLDGLIWSEDTRWPKKLHRMVLNNSRKIGLGMYQVDGPNPEYEPSVFRHH
jgi:hypothetical protein